MDLLELGKKAVSESSPAGSDVRYDPEYDELQQEIDKLTSVTAGGPIDWKHVLKLCASILDAKSKDMKVATYLGVALLHLKGIEGFSAGTQILLDLVEGYWDTMYPLKKRMRGRFNAISWWSDCSEKFLNDYDGGDIPKDIVDLLLDRLEKLDGALSDKSEDAPMLNSLSDYVRRLPVQSPAPEVEEQPEDVPQDVPQDGVQDDVPQVEDKVAPAGTSEQSSTPVSFGKINSEDDCNRELEAGLAGLSDVSEYLLSTNLSDSSSYRLRRMVAWIPVRGLPPGDKGSTMIPPPDESIKKSIMSQLKAQDFVGAVQAAEALVGQYLFWIDLSRLTSEALDGLGNEYLDAKLAVELETGFFVKRMSGIESMTFSDGTPFADAGTRSWLKSLNQEKAPALFRLEKKDRQQGRFLSRPLSWSRAKMYLTQQPLFRIVTIELLQGLSGLGLNWD